MKKKLPKRSKLNKPMRLGIVVGLLFLVFAVGFLAIHHSKRNIVSGGTASSNSSTSNQSSNNPISLAPQDTLSQWKADPNYLNPQTGISYDELFRNSDKYKGQFVHYKGKVIQVLGDSGNWNLRVNVTEKGDAPYTYWDDAVYIYSYSPDRVIEKDIIDFTAQSNGVITYKSVLGGDITIPSLTIYEQQVVGRAD